MAKLIAPFASRAYSDVTHHLIVREIPTGDVSREIDTVIKRAVAGFIETVDGKITRITTVELKQ